MRCPTLSTETPRTSGARGLALAGLAVLLLAGCRQDMHDAPRFDPLEKTSMTPDGRSARYPVAGTVARGHLNADSVLFAGKDAAGALVADVPLPVDAKLLARGRERFNIFCSPCHDQLGTGNGMIVRRGYKQPETYHSDRLRAQPVGYFFDVITNGFGQMPSYGAQVPVKDRWAIAAYIRVLQFSQNARLADLSPVDRQAITAAEHAPAGAHEGAGEHAGAQEGAGGHETTAGHGGEGER